MSDTAIKVLDRLREGNRRFLAGTSRRKEHQEARPLVKQAKPVAAIVGCIDSRVAPELVFDQDLGDLMTARVGGNILNGDIVASLEIACGVAGVELVVVLGHSDCVAVRYACKGPGSGETDGLLEKIRPAVDATSDPEDPEQRSADNDAFVNAVSRCNAAMVASNVVRQSAVLADLQAQSRLMVVSAYYDTDTGAVEFQS